VRRPEICLDGGDFGITDAVRHRDGCVALQARCSEAPSDGTHARGTFSGTLAAADGTSGFVALTNGSFSLLLGDDAHCTIPAEAN